MPLGKFRNHCGWTMYKAECVRETKTQSGREAMCTSLNQQWVCGRRVLTTAPLTIGPQPHACMKTSTHIRTHLHFLAFSVRGLRRPSKRGREIGQGPAGSLSSPLEDQGRLKLPRLLSLPRYPPLFLRTVLGHLKTPLEEPQPGGLGSRLFYNDVRDPGG